jgi:hypothetical protein
MQCADLGRYAYGALLSAEGRVLVVAWAYGHRVGEPRFCLECFNLGARYSGSLTHNYGLYGLCISGFFT